MIRKIPKKTVSFRVDEDLKVQMEERAKENGRSLAGEIVQAIKFYLKYGKMEYKFISTNKEEKQIIAHEPEKEEVIDDYGMTEVEDFGIFGAE